jgi:glucose-6-phosphate isomerase
LASSLEKSPAWLALQSHYDETKDVRMRDQFENEPDRFSAFSISFQEILFDYSKNRINTETSKLLLDLARQSKLNAAIQSMFSGEPINQTEERAVLHTALRNREGNPVFVDGKDVMPDINRVLDQFTDFAETVRSGQWLGYNGKPIRHIVNIGIGGSDLGPKMVTQALKPYWTDQLRPHFVANIDGADICSVLADVEAESTLFIIASKSFSTRETMANAHAARTWFLEQTGNNLEHVAKHFVALSSSANKVREFGISESNMFELWDWVGGRYSLWSAIGLPIALMIGKQQFLNLLDGAYAIDQHFYNAPFENNIPVMMAMLGVWYRNFYGTASQAIVPYDHNLRLLPSHLQQLDMESNGKAVTMQGESVKVDTGPIIWGAAGPNGQHAFFQLLHQGTQLIPTDFIVPINSKHPITSPDCNHHQLLFANCLAQSEALMRGREFENVASECEGSPALAPHRSFKGNRPSNTLLLDELTPENLGALIALYEHKVFVQGVVWGVNSFDQWGVELGKKLAEALDLELTSGEAQRAHDSSTSNLLTHFRQRQAT